MLTPPPKPPRSTVGSFPFLYRCGFSNARRPVNYLNGEVSLAFAGYGLPYHLLHARDAIVWLTFVAGILTFMAAVAFLAYAARKRLLAGRT